MCTLLHHSRAECEEFDVTLALLDEEPAAHAPPSWITVRQLDGRKAFAASVGAVRALVSELKPDATVSFLTRSNMANVLSANGRPSIISERANTSAHFGAGLKGWAQRTMVRTLYPRAARVIAVSEGVAEDLRENFSVRPERLIAIPNPVDVETIRAKADEMPDVAIEGPYILAAGRLVKSKNFDMLIRAFAASGDSRKLVIVGEGGEREPLLRTASELGVADRVVLPGFSRTPYALMRKADMFVLCSNAEGFPNALVEAMAVGAPVIATNCPSGPSEILAETSRDALSGLTFARHGVIVPTNAPDLMAEALRALNNPERRRDYAAKAEARARAYSAETAKNRYWDVIRAVLP
jgi:N-acetylgalactosamine-N,N'-diacetylbacillosaminyl-diphospho-undecaprenol 4-alpha-N-acetylgalactosaminyltransferase